MSLNLAAKIRRAATDAAARDGLHFHLQHDGHPYVCDVAQCESPAVSLDEVHA